MKKWVLGCLGAAVLGVCMLAAASWFLLFRELPVLDASLSMPSQVQLDATLMMAVTARNPHATAVTLDSIDIDESFLAGFQVLSVAPEPIGTMKIPLIDQRSWEFGMAIAPGDELTVTFELKAVSAGHFSGNVDLCNPNQDFSTVVADVVVREASSSQAGEGDEE